MDISFIGALVRCKFELLVPPLTNHWSTRVSTEQEHSVANSGVNYDLNITTEAIWIYWVILRVVATLK